MITIETLTTLRNNDGLTLKKYTAIIYKSGYQVATEGVYYIDKSHRVNTKREALEVGRACKQISVLKWANMELIYC